MGRGGVERVDIVNTSQLWQSEEGNVSLQGIQEKDGTRAGLGRGTHRYGFTLCWWDGESTESRGLNTCWEEPGAGDVEHVYGER
jgi:hypothetical protein